MENFPNKKDRKIVLFSWLFFFIAAIYSLIFVVAFVDPISISCCVIFSAIAIYLTVLVKKVSKNYKLKYIHKKKEYLRQINESLPKYIGASEAFIKDLYKVTKDNYYCTGNIYYVPTVEDTKWLFRSVENKMGLTMLISTLANAVKKGTGVVGFITDSYNVSHDGYLTLRTLNNGFLSGELRYLICDLFDLCELNLEDNHLSIEYSTELEKIKEKLTKEYDSIFYGFSEEILLLEETMLKKNVEVS